VTTWEISFAQSKDAEQSSLEQSQENAGICTRSHADFDSQRFLRTTALWRLGVSVPEKQLRQVYRWKLFREAYEEARRVFVTDWGTTPPKKAESITRSILADWERLGG
jgi:hypothetical protein